jgi:MFS transporter, PHS family, inorganic phosphate transporter
MPQDLQVLLRIALLLGIFLGQLSFGLLADLYGRKHLYGYELLVLIVGAVGLTMSSPGAANSMSIFGWLFAWKFIMGIGISRLHPVSKRRSSANFSRYWR